MRKKITKVLSVAVVAMGLVFMIGAASAADISFSTGTENYPENEVSKNGTLIGALNLGETTDVTINTVLFDGTPAADISGSLGLNLNDGVNVIWAGASENSLYSGSGLNAYTVNSPESIVQSFISFRGLTVGAEYEIQLMFGDFRGLSRVNISVDIYDQADDTGLPEIENLNINGKSQIVTGTFTADATTQNLFVRLRNNGAYTMFEGPVNALQIRRIYLNPGFDDFASDPDIAVDWANSAYFGSTGSASWNAVDQDLDLVATNLTSQWSLMRRWVDRRAATNQVSVDVKALSASATDSKDWAVVGLSVSHVAMPTSSGANSSQPRYIFTLETADAGATWFYRVRKDSHTAIYTSGAAAIGNLAFPIRLSIGRVGTNYNFTANGSTLYTASEYSAAQHDDLPYYHLAWGCGYSASMTATVDNFGVPPPPPPPPPWPFAEGFTDLRLDAYDTSTLTIDASGAVSQWDDLSKNGYDVMQATPGNRPVYQGAGFNFLPTISFDGKGDALYHTSLTLPQPHFVIMVMDVGTFATLDGYLDSYNNVQHFMGGSAVNNYQLAAGSASTVSTNAHYSPSLLAAQFNGASSAQYINAVALATGVNVGANGLNGVMLGNARTPHNSVANSTEMTLSEVVIVPGVISEENRQKLEGYLAHKWALKGNLPEEHPYKAAPPAPPLRGTVIIIM